MSTNEYNLEGNRGGSSRYTEDDAVLIDQAKRIHRTTTESSSNALQTALRTRELGANTLEELQRQGQKLDLLEGDFNELDTDIKESKSILAYMRRCCLCFLCACCCDCDPNKERDETRKARVQMRQAMRAREQQMYAQGKPQQSYATGAGGGATAYANGRQDAQRSELFGGASSSAGYNSRENNPAYRIGEHLDAPDRDELQSETEKQERNLDQIGGVLEDLKRMGNDMNVELNSQDDKVVELVERAGNTTAELNKVNRGAQQDFALRNKSGGEGRNFKTGARVNALKYAAKNALK